MNNETPQLPLGYRINNPGDIRHDPNDRWHGELGTPMDGFCHFETVELGLRAMMLNLRNYQMKDNLRTIRQIVTRYAPPSENDTDAYCAAVSRDINIDQNADIDLAQETNLVVLAQGMVRQELGVPPASIDFHYWYDPKVYAAAYAMLPPCPNPPLTQPQR